MTRIKDCHNQISQILELHSSLQALYSNLKSLKLAYQRKSPDLRNHEEHLLELNKEKADLHNLFHKAYYKEVLLLQKYQQINIQESEDNVELLNDFFEIANSLKTDLYYIGIQKLKILFKIYIETLDFFINKKYKRAIANYSKDHNIKSDQTFTYQFKVLEDEYDKVIETIIKKLQKNNDEHSALQLLQKNSKQKKLFDAIETAAKNEELNHLEYIFNTLHDLFILHKQLNDELTIAKTSYLEISSADIIWQNASIKVGVITAVIGLILTLIITLNSQQPLPQPIKYDHEENKVVKITPESIYFLRLASDIIPYTEKRKQTLIHNSDFYYLKNHYAIEKLTYRDSTNTKGRRVYCVGCIFNDYETAKKAAEELKSKFKNDYAVLHLKNANE